MNRSEKLVSLYKEKADICNDVFASVCTGNLSSHTSQVDGQQDGDGESTL